MAQDPATPVSTFQERCTRALGIMTKEQLTEIKETPIAIGGLGLGGSVFINLVRFGFSKFHLADPDVFERTNINRQRGAKETTIGARKDQTLIKEALEINPDLEIKTFPNGVKAENADEFLEGIKWAVDAVDIFAIPDKISLHEKAFEKKIPIVSCVSVGFGAAITVFDSTTPTFGDLSGLKKTSAYETNIQNFVKFCTPEVPGYMAHQLSLALSKESHIPFVVSGVEFSAGLVATEICKHILKTGRRPKAPTGIYLDPVNFIFQEFRADWRHRDPQIQKAL